MEVTLSPPLDKCQDKDECLDAPCGDERVCENNEGGFTCECVSGTWDGTQCGKFSSGYCFFSLRACITMRSKMVFILTFFRRVVLVTL